MTDVLEKKLQETPWLDYIESETRAGQTVIYINLRDDTPAHNVPAIWYQIRKKMQDIAPSLPEGAQGPSVNDEFDDTYGTIYGFIPDGYSLEEVRQRVETSRRELMSVPDIGKTVLLGEPQEQIVIAFSPARLYRYGAYHSAGCGRSEGPECRGAGRNPAHRAGEYHAKRQRGPQERSEPARRHPAHQRSLSSPDRYCHD